ISPRICSAAMIKLTCPGCGTILSIPPYFEGKTCRCPQCKHVSVIPGPAEAFTEKRTDPLPTPGPVTLATTPPPAAPSQPPDTRHPTLASASPLSRTRAPHEGD